MKINTLRIEVTTKGTKHTENASLFEIIGQIQEIHIILISTHLHSVSVSPYGGLLITAIVIAIAY